jgi:hypothetical protein
VPPRMSKAVMPANVPVSLHSGTMLGLPPFEATLRLLVAAAGS